MADLRSDFVGIKSPNPFWLASAPPTDKEYNVVRAFKAGWGGVVWKTLGEEGPPIVNVNGPRYGAIHGADRRLLGLNNIELITDRPLEINLREIKKVKREWPDRAMVVSLMVPCEEEPWKKILGRVEETEADGVELNFGCPHGMSERGMGSAVGQVPEYIEMVARWCKQHTRMPVIVKLTPNITDIRHRGPRRQARRRRRRIADQHHQLDHRDRSRQFRARTHHRRQGQPWRLLRPGGEADCPQHGVGNRPRQGNPRVPHFRNRRHHHLARRGGIHGTLLRHGAGVRGGHDLRLPHRRAKCNPACRAGWTRRAIAPSRISAARAVGNVTDWQYLNLNYVTKARIDQDLCIKCGRCYAVCEDTSHQAIAKEKNGKRHFEVIDAECVACNLCIEVCPVENCITMQRMTSGTDPRTGRRIDPAYANWTTHPNNPMALKAAE